MKYVKITDLLPGDFFYYKEDYEHLSTNQTLKINIYLLLHMSSVNINNEINVMTWVGCNYNEMVNYPSPADRTVVRINDYNL